MSAHAPRAHMANITFFVCQLHLIVSVSVFSFVFAEPETGLVDVQLFRPQPGHQLWIDYLRALEVYVPPASKQTSAIKEALFPTHTLDGAIYIYAPCGYLLLSRRWLVATCCLSVDKVCESSRKWCH